MKILIIEDNPTDSKLLLKILEKAGCKVLTAESAEQAFANLRKVKVDLVVADVLLPGIDGFTFTRIMKDSPELRAIPVVATSACRDWPFRRLATSSGCAAYLEKPLDTRALAGQLSALCHSSGES